MAQIPQLERFQSGKTLPQNDRISMKAQDQGSQIINQTNAIADIADKGQQMYDIYEKDKIEQISNVAEQEYTKWNNDQLQKLKNYQGDPTEAYAEYDKAVNQKKLDMIADRPDYGENVMASVGGRLDKVISQQSIQADHQRGQQSEIYANNVFESTVKLKRDGLATNAGFIKAGDPTSYMMFEQNAADMKAAIAKRGIKQGTVTVVGDDVEGADSFVDDDGKVVKMNMSPMAKARYFKEMSEGVKSSLNVLISGEKIEEAKEFQEKYKGFLDPNSLAVLNKKMGKETTRLEAIDFIKTLKGDSSDIDKIDKIDRPELQEKVLQLKSAKDGRIQAMRNRFNKVNGEKALSRIEELRKGGKEFHNFSDFESDPVFKNIEFDKLDTKTQRAITEAVVTPKTSDPKSIDEMHTLFSDNIEQLNGMSYETFQREHLVGLDKSERKKWSNRFEKYKTPSASAERATSRRASQLLKEQLRASKYISDDGKDEKSKKRYNKLNDQLLDYISDNNITSDDQIRKLTKEIAAKGVFSGVRTPSDDAPDAGNASQNIKGLDRVKLVQAFKKATGSTTNPLWMDPKLQTWVSKNKDKVLKNGNK